MWRHVSSTVRFRAGRIQCSIFEKARAIGLRSGRYLQLLRRESRGRGGQLRRPFGRNSRAQAQETKIPGNRPGHQRHDRANGSPAIDSARMERLAWPFPVHRRLPQLFTPPCGAWLSRADRIRMEAQWFDQTGLTGRASDSRMNPRSSWRHPPRVSVPCREPWGIIDRSLSIAWAPPDSTTPKDNQCLRSSSRHSSDTPSRQLLDRWRTWANEMRGAYAYAFAPTRAECRRSRSVASSKSPPSRVAIAIGKPRRLFIDGRPIATPRNEGRIRADFQNCLPGRP